MKFYVARHGQTEWNALDKVCGRTDIPLTAKGEEQAKIMGQKLRGEKIDLVVVSPMIRAQQTAKIAAKEAGISEGIFITDERLIEQDYGIYEGADRLSEGFLNNKRNFARRYPGGESHMMVAQRTYNLIDELRQHHPDKNILFVCHGGVCRVINTYFTDIDNDDFYRWGAENSSFLVYEIGGKDE